MTGEEEPISNLRHLEQPQCEVRIISSGQASSHEDVEKTFKGFIIERY